LVIHLPSSFLWQPARALKTNEHSESCQFGTAGIFIVLDKGNTDMM
jgi:hypothetical protein